MRVHIGMCECSDDMWQFPQSRQPRQPSTARHTSISISPPLLWRTSSLLFIHYWSCLHLQASFIFPPLLCSPLLLIGAPVPIPVTAVVAIRSAVGLFKAWGTQGLDLLCHLRTSKTAIKPTKATCMKSFRHKSIKIGLIWGVSQGAPSVVLSKRSSEVFASNMHGLMWPANSPGQVQSVLPLWRSAFS